MTSRENTIPISAISQTAASVAATIALSFAGCAASAYPRPRTLICGLSIGYSAVSASPLAVAAVVAMVMEEMRKVEGAVGGTIEIRDAHCRKGWIRTASLGMSTKGEPMSGQDFLDALILWGIALAILALFYGSCVITMRC
jgi:hypothetical protein